jgi:hypothetical protein
MGNDWPAAYHEAGHIAAMQVFHDPIALATVEEDGSGGVTRPINHSYRLDNRLGVAEQSNTSSLVWLARRLSARSGRRPQMSALLIAGWRGSWQIVFAPMIGRRASSWWMNFKGWPAISCQLTGTGWRGLRLP